MRQLGIFALLVSAACLKQPNTGSVDTAESAVDSSDGVDSEGNVMVAAVDGADMTGLVALTADQVAARIAANVALRWQPSTCATVTVQGSTIAIIYNECTGPRGLLHVTGELDLVVSVSLAGGISVHATSNGLMVNSADLAISADATYAVSGTTHTLTVQTQGAGTGPRGNTIDHTGSYTVTWDATCRSIDGHWATEIGAADRSNDVALERCAGGCPTGTVTHHYLAGASITVTFDGTATAQWTASNGKTGTVALTCGQ